MCYQLRKGFDVNLTTGLKLNFFYQVSSLNSIENTCRISHALQSYSNAFFRFSGLPLSFLSTFFVVPFTIWSSCIGKIKSRDSFQVLECLKTIPSSPNSARTPSPTFLNERKCHSEIWSSSSQRISEHCWVCDLISHIGHAREKTFPIIKN